MTALIQQTLPEASSGSADRATKALKFNRARRFTDVTTQNPAKDERRAGGLLKCDFAAGAPNCTWLMDFTCYLTWVGLVYLPFIIELFAQKIVAWFAATHKDAELVMFPLRMATLQRKREGHPIESGQLIGYVDELGQYTSITFTEHLDLEGIRLSTGTVAVAHDNALIETVTGLFKAECIRALPCPTKGRTATLWTLIGRLPVGATRGTNNQHLDNHLNYLTPAHFEQAHDEVLNRELQPVKKRHRT